MKFILCLLLLIQIQKCKPENVAISQFDGKERLKDQKSHIDTYLINFVEKSLIGSEILDQKKITELKNTLKIALSRQTERPYMWDVFVSSNSDLLQFYDYKVYEEQRENERNSQLNEKSRGQIKEVNGSAQLGTSNLF